MAEHSRVFTCKFYIQDRTELAGPIIAWVCLAGSVQISTNICTGQPSDHLYSPLALRAILVRTKESHNWFSLTLNHNFCRSLT